MSTPVFESLIPWWPVGELGVAVGRYQGKPSIVLRRGLSKRQRAMAMAWAEGEIRLERAAAAIAETVRNSEVAA